MSGSLALFSEILRGEPGCHGSATMARFLDGSTRPLPLERWMGIADESEERCLGLLDGPVLDVGCGPGRHLHALARSGVFGLGVDISQAAVALARGAGARAIVASIFDELPGTGSWRSALLLDGNVGIGGRPTRLLRRIADLLAPGGRIFVELATPDTATVETLVRLENPRVTGDWFPWAEVSAADAALVAAGAGLELERLWDEGGRWFALLRRPRTGSH
jgi:SAM-dependent methyltransferase